MNEIWAANDGYMLNMLLKLIEKIKVPLKIKLSVCSSMNLLHPNDFAID